MKILYVLSHIQHPTMRGALRYYYFMRGLTRRHAVTVLVLAEREVSPQASEEWRALAQRMLIFSVGEEGSDQNSGQEAPSSRVLRKSAYRLRLGRTLRKMRKAFLELVRREHFDVVLFSGKKVYPVIEDFSALPVVIDFCDATTLRERQRLSYVSGLELARQLWRYAAANRTQRKMLRQTSHLAFISPRDRDAVLSETAGAIIVPNGIDLDYWSRTGSRPEPHCIVFTGVMNYPPNEDAALFIIKEILPRLTAALPDVEVLIVGRDPTPALIELGNQHDKVTVTGYVEDVRPYLERASVFIAPIRFASGLQNKVLEALAMAVPVVTTPIVAAGLRADGGPEPPLMVAEAAEEFSRAVLSLVADEQARARLCEEGRRFVQAHFDWSHSAALLETLCLQAAEEDLWPGRGAEFSHL